MYGNSMDLDQMLYSAVSDLSLHFAQAYLSQVMIPTLSFKSYYQYISDNIITFLVDGNDPHGLTHC